jgi:hypothetical protein
MGCKGTNPFFGNRYHISIRNSCSFILPVNLALFQPLPFPETILKLWLQLRSLVWCWNSKHLKTMWREENDMLRINRNICAEAGILRVELVRFLNRRYLIVSKRPYWPRNILDADICDWRQWSKPRLLGCAKPIGCAASRLLITYSRGGMAACWSDERLWGIAVLYRRCLRPGVGQGW